MGRCGISSPSRIHSPILSDHHHDQELSYHDDDDDDNDNGGENYDKFELLTLSSVLKPA